MGIPDLLGLNLYDALDLLEKNYPELSAVVVRYYPAISKKYEKQMTGTERIIRQKVLGSNRIELVVSVFYDFPAVD